MDGTLLGDDHKIAPETQVAIKRACDAGIRFMVATGRNFRGAMDALKEYLTEGSGELLSVTKYYARPLSSSQSKRTTFSAFFLLVM